ncbi:MAG: carboxypeptidase-like regulatory domain-containing protein [Terriglobales bacterium]
MRYFLRSVVVVLLVAAFSHAQTFRGAINGTVVDPSGAVVAGAEVKATNNGTAVVLVTTSTSEGQFAFQDLPLGSYKISVNAPGFQAVNVDNVSVTAGSVYTLPVKLTLGQQTTAIEVSAASVAVDTTTSTQSMTIPATVVQNVPLNGRDFTQLIATAPGYGGYAVGGYGSLNGTRPNQMNWQIDGVDNNDFWHNIPAVNQGGVSGIAGVIMPIDATDEFSAQTQSSAEAGRNAGGTVNLVLKSGTNGLHGSAYYYNRNEFYGAASPFFQPSATVPRAPALRNQNYGFSLGGPIKKDKAFFFTSFEKQQYLIGLSGLATEPSFAWQTKALALLTANGITPSPLSQTLLGNPVTNTSPILWPSLINNLPAVNNNFFSPIASTGYSYNGVAKVDYNFTDKHRLSVRWFGGQGSQTAPLGGSPALGTASSNLQFYFEKAPIHVYNYAATLNSVLTPRMTNQLLFGINYFNQTFSDANNSFDTKALGLFLSPDATIKGQPILGAPNIAISGFEQIGLTPPEGRNDVTGMLADIVSYNVGRHQIRFGGEVRQGRVNEFYHRRGTGKFSFDGTQGPWAGTCASDDPTCALADFLAGDVSTSSIAVGNPERFVRVNAFNFFGQDSIQVTRKLNINFGLRYEYFGPLYSPNKDLAVFIPGRGMEIQGAGISSIFPPDRNNVAPRFGFAYQPKSDGDLVVRGGIGVFYDQINMNPFLDFRPPISAADGLQDNPVGPAAVSNFSLNGYNWDAVQAGGASVFPGVTLCPSLNFNTDPGCGIPQANGANTYNVYSVNQNFRAPYFYNYNLQVEKSLGNAAVFQIGYVGSEGRKLSTMLNINQLGADPTGRFNGQYPNAGSIIQLNSNGTSNYNSLQTSLRIRAFHGLSTQFNYTWAHALDVMSEYRGVIPLDSYNLKAEYGNGDFDTRHNFTTTLTYDVPGSSHGPRILTHGWQVSSLLSFHTGQPFNITGGFNRPGCDLVADPFAGVSHTFSAAAGGEQWVNPAAFNCTTPTTFLGNLTRNKFYGPGYGSVDLSVFKNVPIGERLKVQLRAEMFNLLNRINLASGGGAVGSNGFVSDTIGDFNGAPGIGPGEAFNMQLAAKIIF